MDEPGISASTLLERLECQWQIADGRTLRLCRDARGAYWVIDDAERVVPLGEFADELHGEVRRLAARERAMALREIARGIKAAFARLINGARQVEARAARA